MKSIYAHLIWIFLIIFGLTLYFRPTRESVTRISATKFFVSGKPRQIIQVQGASLLKTSPISKSGKATSERRTVYTWSNDKPGVSTWKEANWPLVYVDGMKVRVSGNVSASVSVAPGPGRTRGMLLINGYPVYQYVVDKSSANFRGEGIAPSETNIPPGIWQTVNNAKGPLRKPNPSRTIARPGLLTDQCSAKGVRLCADQMIPTDSLVCIDGNTCKLADYSDASNPCGNAAVEPCGFVAPLCPNKKCCNEGGVGCASKDKCYPYKSKGRGGTCRNGDSTCRCVQDRFNNRLGKHHKHAHKIRHQRRKKN